MKSASVVHGLQDECQPPTKQHSLSAGPLHASTYLPGDDVLGRDLVVCCGCRWLCCHCVCEYDSVGMSLGTRGFSCYEVPWEPKVPKCLVALFGCHARREQTSQVESDAAGRGERSREQREQRIRGSQNPFFYYNHDGQFWSHGPLRIHSEFSFVCFRSLESLFLPPPPPSLLRR